jgi:hypothetical protein
MIGWVPDWRGITQHVRKHRTADKARAYTEKHLKKLLVMIAL